MQKNHRIIQNAWCWYDWANSVYALTITTAIFPLYYSQVTPEIVSFFGWQVKSSALYSYAISFSFLIAAILSPALSGIADYSGRKKFFMQLFTTIGATSCMALFFFQGNVEYGIFFITLASVGFTGAIVFYNAFLPEIATPDLYDRLSAKGYAMGYAGSVILLILNILSILKHEWFGFENQDVATRASFVMVGIWWIGFAQIPFFYLKDNPTNNVLKGKIIRKGFSELKKVARQLRFLPNTQRYLWAFFFYSMGVQTVMYLASLFGERVIGMESAQLIVTILVVQILGIIGAIFFAHISEKSSNKTALLIMLAIWIAVCISAFFTKNSYQFMGLAGLVGLVMGGIQSLSRSTYSKLIPKNTKDHASFFSFYDVTEKIAVVLGTASYGLIDHLTGNMRNSALALSTFFIIGMIILWKTPLRVSSYKIRKY
ncbi:MAG: MFS transporter [Cytophagales bacterium]|nr:MFS transporter [Cytophagales bacterium]MDW8383854.1 MFS transporter [Flammeovirgaceae bacterium]